MTERKIREFMYLVQNDQRDSFVPSAYMFRRKHRALAFCQNEHLPYPERVEVWRAPRKRVPIHVVRAYVRRSE